MAFKNEKVHGYAFLGPKLWKLKNKKTSVLRIVAFGYFLQRDVTGTTISYRKKTTVPNIAYLTFPTGAFIQFTLGKMLHFGEVPVISAFPYWFN